MARIRPFEEHTQQYEDWFTVHRFVYESEIKALQQFVAQSENSLEIGVGSGRFAVPLGIKRGLEPSPKMREIARLHGILVDNGVGENLPYKAASFELVLMVTTICFLDNVSQSFLEVHRVLKPTGSFIIGFIDKNSPLGKIYLKHQKENLFYREAQFYSVAEVLDLLQKAGFGNFQFIQTIFHGLEEIKKIEPVKSGYGEGSFVVVKARKLP